MGSTEAWRYYRIEFEHLEQTMVENILSLQDLIVQQTKPQPIIVQKKPGPNEKCPCGSGKKYEKCCRDNPDKFLRMLTEVATEVATKTSKT